MLKKVLFSSVYFVLFTACVLLTAEAADLTVNSKSQEFPIVYFTLFLTCMAATIITVIMFLASWEQLFESGDQEN